MLKSAEDFLRLLNQRRFYLRVRFGPNEGPEASLPWPDGFDLSSLTIAHEKSGKPVFAGQDGVHLSISHCAGAIALAISRRPIGVDIESRGRLDERIVRRMFTGPEHHYLAADPALRDERFTELWTRKEALVKRSGDGTRGLIRRPEVLDDSAFVTFHFPTHVASVCAQR